MRFLELPFEPVTVFVTLRRVTKRHHAS